MAQPQGATSSGTGTAGPGAAPPAPAPQARPQAAPPGPQGAPTPAPPSGQPGPGGPASPAVDWQARARDLESRLTDQGRQLKEAAEIRERAVKLFGAPEQWDAATAPPPSPQRPPAPQAPQTQVDGFTPQEWDQFATETFLEQWNAGNRGKAIGFARQIDAQLRTMGIVPPWEGMPAVMQAIGGVQGPQGASQAKYLTQEDLDKALAARDMQAYQSGRDFAKQMASIPTQLAVTPQFLAEQVEAQGAGGITEKMSRAEWVEDYCVRNGVSPLEAATALFRGDLMRHWQQTAYQAAMNQAAQDQLASGPAPGRTVPFREAPANEQTRQALAQVGEGRGVLGLQRPENAAEVVFDDQSGAPPR